MSLGDVWEEAGRVCEQSWYKDWVEWETNGFGRRKDIEVPSRVDGKRRNLARLSVFLSWDEACQVPRQVPRHKTQNHS